MSGSALLPKLSKKPPLDASRRTFSTGLLWTPMESGGKINPDLGLRLKIAPTKTLIRSDPLSKFVFAGGDSRK